MCGVAFVGLVEVYLHLKGNICILDDGETECSCSRVLNRREVVPSTSGPQGSMETPPYVKASAFVGWSEVRLALNIRIPLNLLSTLKKLIVLGKI